VVGLREFPKVGKGLGDRTRRATSVGVWRFDGAWRGSMALERIRKVDAIPSHTVMRVGLSLEFLASTTEISLPLLPLLGEDVIQIFRGMWSVLRACGSMLRNLTFRISISSLIL